MVRLLPETTQKLFRLLLEQLVNLRISDRKPSAAKCVKFGVHCLERVRSSFYSLERFERDFSLLCAVSVPVVRYEGGYESTRRSL